MGRIAAVFKGYVYRIGKVGKSIEKCSVKIKYYCLRCHVIILSSLCLLLLSVSVSFGFKKDGIVSYANYDIGFYFFYKRLKCPLLAVSQIK